MLKPYCIAISGIMGSGKSTLAKGLAKVFEWELAHPSLPAKYLPDLFMDMDRWAFEAQISFMTSKVFSIMQLIRENQNFILDRSLYEDSEIFVNYFYSKGKIDKRGYITYNNLLAFFDQLIVAPDLIIHCECDLETVKKRIEIRNKDFQRFYPNNHLEDINNLYDIWLNNFRRCPFYKINTVIHDIRDDKTIFSIAQEIIELFNIKSNLQLNLFENPQSNFSPVYLQPIYSIGNFKNFERLNIPLSVNKYSLRQNRYAYIAAPFTSLANNFNSNESDNALFLTEPLHGSISNENEFRQVLLNIEKKLKSININSILPHRDVSKWGAKYVSANEVFESCTRHVTNCSLFLAIVGESNGSHYELGLAHALKKPIIIIRCSEITNSYISNGINETFKNIKILNCAKLNEIPDLINSKECLEFLHKHELLKS